MGDNFSLIDFDRLIYIPWSLPYDFEIFFAKIWKISENDSIILELKTLWQMEKLIILFPPIFQKSSAAEVSERVCMSDAWAAAYEPFHEKTNIMHSA